MNTHNMRDAITYTSTTSTSQEYSLPPLALQPGDAAPATVQLRLFRLFVRGLFRLFFRVRVVGLERVPSTQVIVCGNHLGWADPFLVMLFLPLEPRIYALGLHPARASAFRTLIVDKLQIMVVLDPSRPRQVLAASKGVLERGGSLLVFPEGGTDGAQEGGLRPLQHGAGHMSVATGAPVLPVAISGTRELWLRKTLTLRIGEPIYPTCFSGDPRTRSRKLTSALDFRLRLLLHVERSRPRLRLLKGWLTGLFV